MLSEWKKPFLTAFGDHDPITGGGDVHFQKAVPGAHGQPHTTVKGAGHFIQETHGAELAQIIIDWLAKNAGDGLTDSASFAHSLRLVP